MAPHEREARPDVAERHPVDTRTTAAVAANGEKEFVLAI